MTVDRAVPSEQRRLVSVLFADLVGFTTVSESRDSEEVRDLLSRYFETCTKLIGRYGGVGEVFDLAIADFRRTDSRFWLAATLTEHGEWLRSQGSDEDVVPLLEEARGLFEGMGATAWLERLGAVEGSASSRND